jgi:hypothetical protein
LQTRRTAGKARQGRLACLFSVSIPEKLRRHEVMDEFSCAHGAAT